MLPTYSWGGAHQMSSTCSRSSVLTAIVTGGFTLAWRFTRKATGSIFGIIGPEAVLHDIMQKILRETGPRSSQAAAGRSARYTNGLAPLDGSQMAQGIPLNP